MAKQIYLGFSSGNNFLYVNNRGQTYVGPPANIDLTMQIDSNKPSDQDIGAIISRLGDKYSTRKMNLLTSLEDSLFDSVVFYVSKYLKKTSVQFINSK